MERALALARPGGDCVVIADETSTANLRWAGNTLTTNGVAASRSLTVISIDRRVEGAAGVGIVSRSGVGPDQVEDVVREAEKAAEQASPAEDANDLVPGDSRGRSGCGRFSGSHGLRSVPRLRGASSGRPCARPRARGASCTASPSTG